MIRQKYGATPTTIPLYAIDPGTDASAIVIVTPESISGCIQPNDELRTALLSTGSAHGHLVIEQVESFGMPVGREVFETVFWSGRFAEAWQSRGLRCSWSRIGRKDVKLALCGTVKAKDPHIRQVLIDRYGGPLCVKKGGSLAGIKSHLWAALAVAVAYQQLEADAGRHGRQGHQR
jgi:hypothetical protein